MKTKLLPIAILFSFSLLINAQNFKVGDIIELTNSIPVKDGTVAIYSEDSNNDKVMKFLEAGVKFRVLEITTSEVKVMALPFDVKSDDQKLKTLEDKPDEIIKSEYYNNKVYTIHLNDFNAFAKTFKFDDRISVGLLTLPFRARPQDDFSFDTEFNLSTSVNFKLFNFYGSSINAQLGAGISSVGLNSENALGVSNENSQDVATLTLFSGVMLQYKKVQIGLYAGVDQINNQSNYQWKSNGNLWLGFGIGFNVFTVSVSSPKNNQ